MGLLSIQESVREEQQILSACSDQIKTEIRFTRTELAEREEGVVVEELLA